MDVSRQLSRQTVRPAVLRTGPAVSPPFLPAARFSGGCRVKSLVPARERGCSAKDSELLGEERSSGDPSVEPPRQRVALPDATLFV